MRLVKFSKDDLVVSLEEANERLADFAKRVHSMKVFGFHQTEYEVWIYLEEDEVKEQAFLMEVDCSDDQDFEENVKSHWQGSHLFMGIIDLSYGMSIALIRKKYD